MHKTVLGVLTLLVLRDCQSLTPQGGELVVGTWGGENAGLIADDTIAHVHIACTFGNTKEGIEAGVGGRFDVAGEYVLRAYPVAVGPSLPARFQGVVSGKSLVLSVVVQDTTADTTVTLGPVRLYFGREPKMQMCPICRTPGEQMASKVLTGS